MAQAGKAVRRGWPAIAGIGRRVGRRGSRSTDRFIPILAAAIVTAFAGGFLLVQTDPSTRALPRETPAAKLSASFALCGTGKRVTCVVDGDTFHLRGDTIRIADIDTPEVHDYRCAAELARGQLATRRLLALLNAGPFSLAPAGRDRDVYGRKLRIVERGGRSIGEILVAEGLAHRWDGKRHPWC